MGSSRRPELDPSEEESSPGGSQAISTSTLAVAGAALLLILALGTALLLQSQGLDLIGAVEALSDAAPWSGPLAFVLLYVLATVSLFPPASVLTLGAGYLFGPLAGTALVSLASTLGATAAFLVSRYLARPLVQNAVESRPALAKQLRALETGIQGQGAKVVLLLRLSPLFPFGLLNYALGAVTNVPLAQYVPASWAGMLPGTFAYVYLGSVGKQLANQAADAGAAGGLGSVDSWARGGLYVLGAVATLWVTRLVSQAASAALAEQQTPEGEALVGGSEQTPPDDV